MQLQSIRLSQAGNLPEEVIPYSLAALRQDLDRVRNVWEDVRPAETGAQFMGT
jgi:hypothetical protein